MRVAAGKKMQFVPGNAQHVGARAEQQDAFGFSDPGNRQFVEHGGVVGVLADGMGGLECGSEASKAAVRDFIKAYEAKTPQESIPDALERALLAANRSVLETARRAGFQNQVGTTLVAAVATTDALHWISAGDSRLYLWRHGRLTQLTTDHIYARELEAEVAQGQMTREEAESHPERASLTSFLGLDEVTNLDRTRRPFPLEPGDQVLMCSDGLYRALSEGEIAAMMNGNPHAACEKLVAEVIARHFKNQDNVTVMAWHCGTEMTNGISRRWMWLTIGMAAMFLIFCSSFGYGLWWMLRPDPIPPPPPTNIKRPAPSLPQNGKGKAQKRQKSKAESDKEQKQARNPRQKKAR